MIVIWKMAGIDLDQCLPISTSVVEFGAGQIVAEIGADGIERNAYSPR
jgi:hypothetical protein